MKWKALQSPALRHPQTRLLLLEKGRFVSHGISVGDRKQDYSGARGRSLLGCGVLPALYALGLRSHGGPVPSGTADGQLVEIELPSTVVKIAAGIVFCYHRSNRNHRHSLVALQDFSSARSGWNIFGVTGGGH